MSYNKVDTRVLKGQAKNLINEIAMIITNYNLGVAVGIVIGWQWQNTSAVANLA